jgi:hypothetical protein
MLCECGCGRDAGLYKNTNRKQGMIAGAPRRFISGHSRRLKREEYRIEDRGYKTPCWIWNMATLFGYAYSRGNPGESRRVHRRNYERRYGKIPAGLEPDHLCRQRACVNPEHVEVVTRAVNTRRGKSAKLTIEQVREIRSLARPGNFPEIARRFNVHSATVCKIVNQKLWKQ